MNNPFSLRRLSPEEDRPAFDCGDADLNEFFCTDSKNSDRQLLSVTYVAEIDGEVIAFFCVSNDAIRKNDNIPRSSLRRLFRRVPHEKRYSSMPAVKIGRLATSQNKQCNLIGTQILDYIKVWFTDGNKTGCRFIIVDAYNKPRIVQFYKNNGFQFLIDDKDEHTRLMYFDLVTFRE